MLRLLKKPQTKNERWTLVEIDGRHVDVRVVQKKGTRRMTLRIVPAPKMDEQVRVTVPIRTKDEEVDKFIQKHKKWILNRIQALPKVTRIEEGAVIPLRGKPHRIVLREGRGIVESKRELEEDVILVHGRREFVRRKIQDYIKKEAKADLAEAVTRHAKTLNVNPKSITLRDTVSRWGSCSENGTLSFCWRIVMAPPEVLDYLAAHEVAHLREMNHSPDFWGIVEQICPKYEQQKLWLNHNGAELHAIV